MKLTLIRKYKKPDYTIGLLYINGVFFCNTIEDTDRGLSDKMKLSDIEKIKIDGKTAIPTGSYTITIDIQSPKYSKSYYWYSYNKGYMPRLMNVKGFSGVLIHTGNSEKESNGCIIVGENKEKGRLINSKDTFKRLYKILKDCKNNKEEVTLTISN